MLPTAQHLNLRISEFLLDNGLHVIIHEDHTIPIVAVDICYHVGSKNEEPERTGFAHLFEHLMFDGSPHVKRGEFDQYITKAGGWSNAYTSWDKTNYYEVIPSNQIELALWLESDRMMELTITDISLETQRSVVKEERRWRVDNQPYGTSEEQVFLRAFKKHPYRWPIIGSMEHLDRASLKDVKNFFDRFYVPNNATLVLAGDISVNDARKLAQKYFDEIPGSSKPVDRPGLAEPSQDKEERGVIEDNVQLPAVFMAYHIPEEGHPDFYPLAIVSDMLTNGDSSRLFRRMVYEKKIAQDVTSFVYNLEQPGLLWISATSMGPASAGDLEGEILAEVDELKHAECSSRELEKVKNQVESSTTFGKQRADQKADMLAHYASLRNDAELINTEIDNYNRISEEDILRVVQKYLVPSNRTVVHYIPKLS